MGHDRRLDAESPAARCAGVLKEWDARLGALDGAGGHFMPRAVTAPAAGAAPPATTGFCDFLGAGDVFVAAPSMSALVQHVLAAAGPRLQTTAATKASSL